MCTKSKKKKDLDGTPGNVRVFTEQASKESISSNENKILRLIISTVSLLKMYWIGKLSIFE